MNMYMFGGAFAIFLSGLSLSQSSGQIEQLAVCSKASNYDSDDFIYSTGDRLLSRFEFDYYDPISLNDRRNLKELKSLINKYRINLVAVPIPYAGALYINNNNNPKPGKYSPRKAQQRYDTYLGALTDGGFTTVNVSAIARSHPKLTFFAKRDHHWTGEAMELVADEIKRLLTNKKINYSGGAQTSIRKNIGEYNGSVADELKKICGTSAKDVEKRTYYDLSIKTQEGLLGESKQDNILVGDSFGTSYFGFNKILSDRLKSPITNLSINGGGCCSAINGYFASLGPNDAKANLIIWTALTVYINSRETRELKPSIFQAYTNNQPIYKQHISTSNSNVVPMNIKLKHSDRYYLKVEAQGTGSDDIKMKIKYGIESESIDLNRKSEIKKPNSKIVYFYELVPGMSNIKSLEFLNKGAIDVGVQLFKYSTNTFE